MGVKLGGLLTWAFTFPGTPYFAGYRALATNGINLPVLSAFKLLGRLAGTRLPLTSSGARTLDDILANGVRGEPDVDGMATLDGAAVQVLVWNYHDDIVTVAATPVHLAIKVPASFGPSARVSHLRVDESHGDAYTVWVSQGMPASPSAAQVAALQQAMDPSSLVPDGTVAVAGGRLRRRRLRSAPVRRLAGDDPARGWCDADGGATAGRWRRLDLRQPRGGCACRVGGRGDDRPTAALCSVRAPSSSSCAARRRSARAHGAGAHMSGTAFMTTSAPSSRATRYSRRDVASLPLAHVEFTLEETLMKPSRTLLATASQLRASRSMGCCRAAPGAGSSGTGSSSGGSVGTGGSSTGSGTGGGSCTNVTACGGNVVGTWTVSSSCLTLSSSNLDISLAGLDPRSCTNVTLTGSLKVTGTWTANVRRDVHGRHDHVGHRAASAAGRLLDAFGDHHHLREDRWTSLGLGFAICRLARTPPAAAVRARPPSTRAGGIGFADRGPADERQLHHLGQHAHRRLRRRTTRTASRETS